MALKVSVFILCLAIAAFGVRTMLSSRANAARPAQAASPQTFEERYPDLPPDSVARRARSNAVMRAQHVPVNKWLPVIESEREVKLPSTEEVAMRAAATLVVALKGEGLEQVHVDAIVRDYQLAPWLSPKEAAFIADPAPRQADRDVNVWRYEAANTLLWALGLVDRLDAPKAPCDPAMLAALLKHNSRAQFLARAKLRSLPDILDQADLIFRYRWALVDARINNRPAPAGLSDDVAMERHQALNWLVQHADTAWDDITLDT